MVRDGIAAPRSVGGQRQLPIELDALAYVTMDIEQVYGLRGGRFSYCHGTALPMSKRGGVCLTRYLVTCCRAIHSGCRQQAYKGVGSVRVHCRSVPNDTMRESFFVQLHRESYSASI